MNSTIRVLYLPPSARQPGQLSRYSFLDEEIRALAESGIEAYVISTRAVENDDEGRTHIRALPANTFDERKRIVAFAARYAHHVPFVNWFDIRRSYWAVRIERFAGEIIRRERIDLIHSFFGWPLGFGGALAKAATEVPLVVGLRGADVNTLAEEGYGSRLNASFDRAFRRLLMAADTTISVSEFLRRRAVSLGARPETSRVILKGVRLDLFRSINDRERVRAELGLGSTPVILSVAGLVPIKGLHIVLEALGEVFSSGHEFSFVVCGEGPQRDALEQLAARLRLTDRVSFRGRVSREEVARYFAAADVLVHGALIEASGNVLLEAMASGLPVVCTDAGGPAEYVTDGVAGFVVPVADPRAMASRIALLLANGHMRDEMGRGGRRRAEAVLGYQRMINETLGVYDHLLGGVLASGAAEARGGSVRKGKGSLD